MPIAPLLQPGSTLILPPGTTREGALRALAEQAATRMNPALSADRLEQLLLRREAQSPTAVPEGVAFPHAIDAEIRETCLVAAWSPTPINFLTPVPVDLVFAMFGSSAEPWRHVRLLARLARIIRAPGALARLRAAGDAESFRLALLAEDHAHD